MKKIYNLAAVLLVSSALYAQQAEPGMRFRGFPTVDDKDHAAFVKAKKALNNTNNKESIDKVFVSHSEERRNASTATLSNFQVPFMPDSLAKEKFTNTSLRGVSTHAVGGIFDPTSDDFVLINAAVARRDDFTVDSVHLDVRYTVIDPGVVDTLMFVMYSADTTYGTSNNALYPLIFNAIPDSRVQGLRYTGVSTHGLHEGVPAGAAQRKVFKRVLTLNDTTASGSKTISAPAEMTISSGNVFCVMIYFIPGAPWDASDIYRLVDNSTGLSETMNNLQTFTYSENNANPALFAYDPSSWGMSHELGTQTRYGTWVAPDDFRNNYAAPQVTGAIWIGYTYSAESTVGFQERTSTGVTLGNNYPNPFNETTRISYNLIRNTNVQFEVTDITGKVVMRTNEGFRTPGIYNIDINANQFKSGVYYYSIITDSGRDTKKMIVLE